MNTPTEETTKNRQPIDIATLTEELDRDIQLEHAKQRLTLHKIIGTLGIINMCILGGGSVIQMQKAMAAEAATRQAKKSESKTKQERNIAEADQIYALKKAIKYANRYGEARQKLHNETIKRISVEDDLKLAKLSKLRIKKQASDTIRLTHHILTFHTSIVNCLNKSDSKAGRCVRTAFYDKFAKKKRGK